MGWKLNLTGVIWVAAMQACTSIEGRRELGSISAAPSFQADVVPLLRQQCAGCHSPGGSAPDHARWFDAAGEPQYATIKEHADLMVQQISGGKMPPGKPQAVPLALLNRLKAWADAGAPDN